MARPKVKGEVIGVRLALPVDAWVRRRAEAVKLSAGEWLAVLAAKHYATEADPVASELADETDSVATPVADGAWKL